MSTDREGQVGLRVVGGDERFEQRVGRDAQQQLELGLVDRYTTGHGGGGAGEARGPEEFLGVLDDLSLETRIRSCSSRPGWW
jgi:hypothetical protein